MDQETKPVPSKEEHSGHHREDEITPADDEMEEIEIPRNKSFYDKVTQVMEKFATTRMGQVIIERTDRVLKVIEDTAKWSLTQDNENVHLERPLPWLFFLILIVCLRSLRIGLSLASFVVGTPRVTAESMVYYIQIKRRRLRAIRVNGLKAISSREVEESPVLRSDSGKRVTFVGKLRTLLGSAVCKPGQHREVPARRVFIQSSDKAQCSKDTTERSTKRPRDDDSVDLNLTVDQMLDKYANDDSDADSDYIPKDDEDECSNSTSCSSSSSDETEKERIDETPQAEENRDPTQNDNSNTPKESIVEIKENGGPWPLPIQFAEIKLEPISDADSGNEQVQTPKLTDNTNGSNDLPQPTDSGATTEVAKQQEQQPQSDSLNTPNIKSQLLTASPQLEEDKQKSTPGHKSAASLKPVISSTAAAGSPQDFHSIFHPAPIVKGSSVDAHSTPKAEAEDLDAEDLVSENSGAETSETAAKNQKKPLPNLNHNKQNYHHNAKNRNKNRR